MRRFRKPKSTFILLLIVSISIGFAYLSSVLNINSGVSFRENSFDVHFENINLLSEDVEYTTLEISPSDSTTLNASINFYEPSEIFEFTVDVINGGGIDAKLQSIENNLTSSISEFITIETKYFDGQEIKENDLLRMGQSKKIRIKVTYNYDIEELPTAGTTTVAITMNYINKNAKEMDYDRNVWTYEYIGSDQTFVVPKTGTYKIELWGAQGGGLDEEYRGLGGYTAGTTELTKGDKFYLFIGGQGNYTHFIDSENASDSKVSLISGEFNAGSKAVGQWDFPDRYWGTGGGATDIRLVNGIWSSFDSLKSRIMVAAGAGGSFQETSTSIRSYIGGSGGGLTGFDGEWLGHGSYRRYGTGATQTAGGYSACLEEDGCIFVIGQSVAIGGFGIGGFNSTFNGVAGGGGGYFGGGGSGHCNSGGGGSSYISGHTGCVAIEESSTKSNITFPTKNSVACTDGTTDIECSKHYSGIVFTDTVMIDGNGYRWTTEKGSTIVGMPTYDGKGTMTGNKGHGYAKITLIR